MQHFFLWKKEYPDRGDYHVERALNLSFSLETLSSLENHLLLIVISMQRSLKFFEVHNILILIAIL